MRNWQSANVYSACKSPRKQRVTFLRRLNFSTTLHKKSINSLLKTSPTFYTFYACRYIAISLIRRPFKPAASSTTKTGNLFMQNFVRGRSALISSEARFGNAIFLITGMMARICFQWASTWWSVWRNIDVVEIMISGFQDCNMRDFRIHSLKT